MVVLEILLKDLSTESRITPFGLVIMEKSKSEVGGNFRNREEHQLKLKAKLNEIKILN